MDYDFKLTCIGFTAPNGDYYNEVLGITGYGSPYKIGDKILVWTKKESDEIEARGKKAREWLEVRKNESGKNKVLD